MLNVRMEVSDENILTVEIDLTERYGLSASGKTVIVGSTQGNQRVPGEGNENLRIGLNVYEKQ